MHSDFNICFTDFSRKGYLVIPSFLSSEEIQALLTPYDNLTEITNHNYDIGEIQETALTIIKTKLTNTIDKVTDSANITVSYDGLHAGYYFASKKVSFGWHQDCESYFATQNHHDYINFYMPLKKPVKEKGNLSFIPWDAFKARCPREYEMLCSTSAAIFFVVNNTTIVIKDEGIVCELPFDINELAVTPELEVGDLLLFSGDVIHQTQDTDTDRVALSVRFTNPATTISYRKLLTGGSLKNNMILQNWHDFGPMIKAFRTTRKKELTWQEIRAVKDKLRSNNYSFETRGFVRKVIFWAQKVLHGNLLASGLAWIRYKKALEYVKNPKHKRRANSFLDQTKIL